MSFAKQLKIASKDVASTATRMIKNGATFSCQIANISVSDGDSIKFPTSKEMDAWMHTLFSKDLKPRVYNERALEAMRKKGITPGKQPAEILLIIVSNSETHVHVGVSIAEGSDIVSEELINGIMGDQEYQKETKDRYSVVSYPHRFPMKERDVRQQKAFDYLKQAGIYVEDEESDDDEMAFTLNDI